MEHTAHMFVEAIKTIAEKPQNLENLECYLSHHFTTWLEKFANTPESLTWEMKEFAEMDFQHFYNAKTDYQDLTAWFKFEWLDAEEILYTFEDTNEPKYALHKKHKMIAALKKHGKGEVILTTLSCLEGCLGCNPALDKLIINLIEKE